MSYPPGQLQRQLAMALKALREDAGLTTYQLAEALGWSQSKVAKIENARTRPTAEDAEAWARTAGASAGEATDIASQARAASTEARSWWSAHRGGLAARQREMSEMERSAILIQHFQPGLIPGLLQSPDYARAALTFADISGRGGIDEAVAARMTRQTALEDESHRFEYVLTEGALRWRPGLPGLTEMQAGRLLAAAARPNVTLSVIPFDSEPANVYLHGFAIFNSSIAPPQVLVENYSEERFLAEPRDVETYERVFSSLQSSALSGDEAAAFLRSLIS